MDGYNLAIVIPSFNEESTIKSVINSVSSFGKVIIVDDGSSDKTASIASSSGAIVYSHAKNLGYDKALNSGFKVASEMGFEYIVTIDADGQHDASMILKIKKLLIDGFDLVVTARNYKQRYSEYLFSIYASFFWSIHDPLSGLKGYRTSLYLSKGFFDSYGSVGTELLFHALRNKFKVVEIKTQVLPRKGDSRFGKSLKTNLKILRAMFFAIFKF